MIFGGAHADLQISGSHGEAIAEAIGTSSTPAIIDVSTMRTGERTRFFSDFAETLRVMNTGPLNLFIDECHHFMPQGRVADPQSANMLHAANNLISLGRSRGLRITIISQRPAKIHKDALTQIHSLIAMRLIAPQDRAAVEAWIADQADITRGKAIIASLPSLKTGEGWIWAPEAEILERIKFPKIKTFDSSRAPDAGSSGPKIVLAPINLDAIQAKLANLKQEKVASDPTALKKRIAELEKQLHATVPAATETKAITAATAEAYRSGYDEAAKDYTTSFETIRAAVAQKTFDLITAARLPTPKHVKRAPTADIQVKAKLIPPPVRQAPHVASDGGMTGPEQRILRSLQFWKSIGHDTPTKAQVAAVAGYAPIGGAFTAPMGKLRSNGMIDYPSAGMVRMANGDGGEPMSMDAAKAMMISVLDGPERRIIDAFAGNEEPMTRADIAAGSGYEPVGGAFTAPVGCLCKLGILEKPAPAMLKLSSWASELLT